MNTLFNNDIFSITKINDKNYIIQYSKENDFIFSSLNIQEFIRSKEDSEDGTMVSVHLNVDSIETLPQMLSKKSGFLSYDTCVKMLLHIGTQCLQLQESGYVYASLHIHNIVVLNDGEVFLYLDNLIFGIERKNMFTLDKYVKKDSFSSPELLSVPSLPYKLYSTSWVYSLGSIVVFSLYSVSNLQRLREEEIKSIIENIQDTKLYFCILRMLEKNYYKRLFLFV